MPLSGKVVKEQIKTLKHDRFLLASTLLSDDMFLTRDKKLVEDVLAQAYYDVDFPEDPVTGEVDFDTGQRLREEILQKADKAGVSREYITGTGKGTFRGRRFVNPLVQRVVEEYERDQETLKPYWEVADELQTTVPDYKKVVEGHALIERGIPVSLWGYTYKTLDELESSRTWKLYQKDIRTLRDNLKRSNAAIREAGIRWGHFKEPKPLTGVAGRSGYSGYGR